MAMISHSPLSSLPNTGGIEQILKDLSKLKYVKFTTLVDYIWEHEPVGEIEVLQDLADGSFNGYCSWAEKAYCHRYWSEIAKDRRKHASISAFSRLESFEIAKETQNQLNQSYEKRLRLLSTTNFGMATPYLAKQREIAVENLIRDMKEAHEQAYQNIFSIAQNRLQKMNFESIEKDSAKYELIDSFFLVYTKEKQECKFLNFHLPKISGENFVILTEEGKVFETIIIPQNKENFLRLYLRESLPEGKYFLCRTPEKNSFDKSTSASTSILKNKFISISFDEKGLPGEVLFQGKKQTKKGSFLPRIKYRGKNFSPCKLDIEVIKDGKEGVAAVQLRGDIPNPDEKGESGKINYCFSLIHDEPYLYVEGNILYPETSRMDIAKPEMPSLARRIDRSWNETAPIEIIFASKANRENPFSVLKKNFLDIESSYRIDYFQHSEKNLNLANINNHITSEYIGVATEKSGMLVAMDTNVQSNFAFCPLKMKHDPKEDQFQLSLNPFGTYFGDQYYQPTWGNGLGFEAAFLAGNQYESSACTYNGYQMAFSLMISFFPGCNIPENTKKDITSFACPPVTILSKQIKVEEKTNLKSPKGFLAIYEKPGVHFHWEGPLAEYKIECGKKSGEYTQKYQSKFPTFFTEEFAPGEKFESGKKYFAKVSCAADEKLASEEISFLIKDSKIKNTPKIPMSLQLKMLMAFLKKEMQKIFINWL